jgi:hypothetical protein
MRHSMLVLPFLVLDQCVPRVVGDDRELSRCPIAPAASGGIMDCSYSLLTIAHNPFIVGSYHKAM